MAHHGPPPPLLNVRDCGNYCAYIHHSWPQCRGSICRGPDLCGSVNSSRWDIGTLIVSNRRGSNVLQTREGGFHFPCFSLTLTNSGGWLDFYSRECKSGCTWRPAVESYAQHCVSIIGNRNRPFFLIFNFYFFFVVRIHCSILCVLMYAGLSK